MSCETKVSGNLGHSRIDLSPVTRSAPCQRQSCCRGGQRCILQKKPAVQPVQIKSLCMHVNLHSLPGHQSCNGSFSLTHWVPRTTFPTFLALAQGAKDVFYDFLTFFFLFFFFLFLLISTPTWQHWRFSANLTLHSLPL